MPELRSGVRQARLQSNNRPEQQTPEPTNNKRPPRRGAGRGTNKAAAPTQPRARRGGRGRGSPVVNLEPPRPVSRAQDQVLNREGQEKKDLGMEGESAEKIVVAEDDASTVPVPERVYFATIIKFYFQIRLGLLVATFISKHHVLVWPTKSAKAGLVLYRMVI